MSFGAVFLLAVIAEVSSLVIVGSWLGAVPSLGLLVLAFGLGYVLLSGRGIATVQRVLGASSQGESPTPALLDGALLAIAGLLFITPGFVSDVVATLLVIPPVRALARRRLTAWVRARIGHVHLVQVPGSGRVAEDDVIDVEGAEVRSRDDAPRPRLPG